LLGGYYAEDNFFVKATGLLFTSLMFVLSHPESYPFVYSPSPSYVRAVSGLDTMFRKGCLERSDLGFSELELIIKRHSLIDGYLRGNLDFPLVTYICKRGDITSLIGTPLGPGQFHYTALQVVFDGDRTFEIEVDLRAEVEGRYQGLLLRYSDFLFWVSIFANLLLFVLEAGVVRSS